MKKTTKEKWKMKMKIIISFLKKKRERWKKEDCYLDYIGEKSILINQKVIVSQVNF